MKKVIYLLLIIILIFSMTGCDLLTSEKEPSIDLAEERIDDGEIDDAIDILEALIDEDDQDYAAWQLMVEAYIEDEAYEDAADVLEDLAEIIIDNYEEDDDDIEDAMDAYADLAKDIMDEDDDIEIESIESLLADEGFSEEADTTDADDTDTGNSDADNPNADNPDIDNLDSDADNSDSVDSDVIMTTSGTLVNGIELKDDEYYYEFTSSGTVIWTANMTEDELDVNFEISISESEDSIRNQIVTYFIDYDMDVEILECRKTDHTLFLSADIKEVEETADLTTVKQEVMDSYDGDYDLLSEDWTYFDYNDQSILSGADLESFKENNMIGIWGIDSYYQFPYNILATDGFDFEYLSPRVIYMGNDIDYLSVIIDDSIVTTDTETTDENTVETIPETSVNGVELMDDEYYYEFTSLGTVIWTANMTEETLDINFEANFDNTEDDIRNQIEFYLLDDGDIEIIDCKKTDHTIFLTLDIKNIYKAIDLTTAKDIVEDLYDGDYDAMIDDDPYYNYIDQSTLSGADLKSVENNSVINIDGNDAYYQFPYDILATNDFDFDYISSQVIWMPLKYDYLNILIDGSLLN